MIQPAFFGQFSVAHGGSGPTDTFAAYMASLNPLVWVRLNETSGTTAADSSGNGINGTYTVDASTITAPGLLIDDSDLGILQAPVGTQGIGVTFPANTVNVTAAYSVFMLIKPTGQPPDGTVGCLFQLGQSGGCMEVDVLGQPSNYKLRVMRSGQSQRYITSEDFNYNDTHSVALTWAPGVGSILYVDGVSVGSDGGDGGNLVSGLHRLFHASFGTPEYSHRGYADEGAFFSRALTATEIQNLTLLGIGV